MRVLNEKLESIMTVEEQALWLPCSEFKLNADLTHYIIYCCQGIQDRRRILCSTESRLNSRDK